MIYLASPYTDASENIMTERWELVCEFSAIVMRGGKHIYSPIAHCHNINKYGLPVTWDFWKRYDTKMIILCDELWVLMLDGWTDSVGISSEIEIATEYGLPITYIDPVKYLNLEDNNE